jgi:uroporphyrinogen-III decarboxylase
MENFLCDIAAESRELTMLLDMLEEHHVELARIYGELGVDVVSLWGDLAMQTTTLMDPRAWRKHFKPRTARVIETARAHGVKYIYLHSDGNNMPIMDDLVEIGLNILDPVQPECMDPGEVRERYPHLVMHGTISSQRTLPFGTVEDVRKEVLGRIEKCGNRNGLAVAPNNVVQFDVSLEKLLCVYETVKEIGPDFYSGARSEA